MSHADTIDVLRLLAVFQVVLPHSIGRLGRTSDDHPAVLPLVAGVRALATTLTVGFATVSWLLCERVALRFEPRAADRTGRPLAGRPTEDFQGERTESSR